MRLDKGGVTTDESLRDLVTLPTASIGSSPPVEDDSGRRLGRMASWKELSGRSLHRGVWGWLRSKRDGDSRATQMSEWSLSSTCLIHGPSPAEEPTSELSGARVPRRGIVSLSEERLERLVSEQGGWLPLTASQVVRTFPSPTRWWSSNNNPLVRARPLASTTPRTTSRCKPSEHCLPHLPATGGLARGRADGGSEPADERRSPRSAGAAPRRPLSR